MGRAVTAALAMGLFAVIVASSDQASACGGFFCSNVSQPVAQAGEQIAFSIDDDGTVTAAVQITWQGPAESFAWIVPVPTVPEISTGTNTLFDGLWNATAVTFATTFSGRTEGVCHQPRCDWGWGGSGGGGIGCGGSSARSAGLPPSRTSDAGPVIDAGGSGDASAGGVTVLAELAVGPYDVVVLEGVDTPSINAWLTDREYLFPPEAVGALDPYVADDFKFVVLRMRKDAPEGTEFVPTGDLVPLVMRYPGGQPCIPVRLTAIATVPDMPITAYFLANGDVRPLNYLETEVPDEVGFWRDPSTYWTALSDEVDLAGGRAFVTEYRGPVPAIPIADVSIDHLARLTDPHDFFPALLATGLQSDPKLLEVMLRNLPPPPGDDPRDFYNCLGFGCSTYDEYLATVPFDSVAFVADLERSILEPRRVATEFLAGFTRLTRLTTTMSAEEMTFDPEFRLGPRGSDVSNVRNAEIVTVCSDRFAADEAPTALVTSTGVRGELTSGTPFVSDEAYCHARGAEVASADDGGGRDSCACRVNRTAPTLSPLVLGLVAAALVLRRHFRRRKLPR